MLNKKRISRVVHVLVMFALVSGTVSLQPVHADQKQESAEGSTVLPPEAVEAFAPLASSTVGNWSALGSNLDGTDGAISNTPGFAVEIDVIAVSGTDVYVGGCFQNAGGDPTADYIAKWDTLTASWSGIGNDGAGTPNGALKSCIRAIAIDGNDVYVGGYPSVWANGAPVPQATHLAKWDGTSWSGLGNGPGDLVTSIVISGDNVYVGVTFTGYIFKWNGTSWSTLGGNGALNGGVEVMKLVNTDLYIGGFFTAVYNGLDLVSEAAYIAKWDTLTETWSALGGDGAGGSSINNAVIGLETDGTDLYVAGGFTDVNNHGTVLTAADYIAKWDSLTGNWSALGDNGAGNGALNNSAVGIQSDGSDVYVSGVFTNVNNGGAVLTAADYIAKWDTFTGDWSALGNNGSDNGSLNLYAYTFGLVGDQLYVGGRFTDVDNNGTVLNTADYIAAYDLCTSGTITVQNNNDAGPGSLRQAIADICPGGTINFDESLAGETIALASTLVVEKDLTMDGSALAIPITISGNNEVQVMLVNSGISLTLDTLTIADGYNDFGSGAGGIRNSGILTVMNTAFSGNSAPFSGGGIYNNGGMLTVTNSTFSNNSAAAGGGIRNSGMLTVTNTDFSNNSADYWGGGITNQGTLTVTNSTFSGNSAPNTGGGIDSNAGTVTITDSVFSGNSAAIGGGIFNNDGILTVANSTFSGNSATHGGNGTGGGIVNTNNTGTGTLIVTNSTFGGNSADYGGGILNYSPSGTPTATVTNSTFSDNSAGFWGGGILNSGVFTLTNSTLSGNTADTGGSIYNDGTLHFANTLLANSTSGGDCVNAEGTISTNTNNLVEDGSCSAVLSGDPLLEPLTDNGGPTQTMALLPGSPAIDAGDDAICAAAPVNNLDQRGVTRPQGSHCDIGAYEFEYLTISGNAGSGDVALKYGHGLYTLTDEDGDYTIKVLPGWSGMVVPVKSGYTFDPVKMNYTDLQSDQIDQDFTATFNTYTPSENVDNTWRVSVTSDGFQADDDTYNPVISADGRYVAYWSFAWNLVPGDGATDIVVHDNQTGETYAASVDSDGLPLGENSHHPSISADGRYIAFTSMINGSLPVVYVHDRDTGVTETEARATYGSLSADGRYLTYSYYDNPGQIYIEDLWAQEDTQVSVSTTGGDANGYSSLPSVSSDGQYVVFQSVASDLVENDTNALEDIFVRKVQTNETIRVSVGSGGAQANAASYFPSISWDGRFVVFHSSASNLVSNDTNGVADVFMHDLMAGETIRVSVGINSVQGNGPSDSARISGDGRFVAFRSYATNLIGNDTNGVADIFIYDRQTGEIKRGSIPELGGQSNGASPSAYSPNFALSGDGRFLAFSSDATNLVSSDTNGRSDIFIRDLTEDIPTLSLVSIALEDGWILESTETSGLGGTKNNTAQLLRVGDDAANRQYRAILSFDTSTLPEGAVITSVTLKFKYQGKTGTLPFSTHGKLLVDICEAEFKNNPALQLGDFNARCPLGKYKAKVLNYINTKVDNWYSQSLNPLDFQFINLEGVTQFRLRFTKDDNNDFGADFLKLFSGNALNEADRPQLVIEYDLP